MFFSIVLTGNHFILDAVAGAIVSFAGLGIAIGLEQMWQRVRGSGGEDRRTVSD